MDRDDGRVLEARGDQGLSDEARLSGVARPEQLLDGDLAIELAIVGDHYSAETAARMFGAEVVARAIAKRQLSQRCGERGASVDEALVEGGQTGRS